MSVSTINPSKGIHGAVTREFPDGKNPNGLIPEGEINSWKLESLQILLSYRKINS